MDKVPTILLTNDDGPQSQVSPFIERFIRAVQQDLGWNIRVCIPSGQRSWIAKAFLVDEAVELSKYTPQDTTIKTHNGWFLATGTPASCVNIALHHLFTDIDLVISGPNLGSNVANTCAMSSGTLGAAMEAAMLGVRSLALSFAFFNHDISSDKVENACQISTNILHKLWHKDAWKSTGSPLFNINIPLVLNPHPPIYITTMGQSHIGSLYVKESRSYKQSYLSVAVDDAQVQNAGSGDHEMDGKDGDAFRFSVAGTRSETDAVLGTDAWAIRKKAVSITPLRPALDSLVEAEKSPFWQQLEFQTI